MQDLPDNELFRGLLAHHEAAHFCVGVRYGWEPRGAWIDGGTRGRVLWRARLATVSDAINQMVGAASGVAAQRQYGAGEFYDYIGKADDHKIVELAARIETALGKNYPGLIPSVRDAAAKFVREHWSDIQFVAEALLSRTTLDEWESRKLAELVRLRWQQRRASQPREQRIASPQTLHRIDGYFVSPQPVRVSVLRCGLRRHDWADGSYSFS